MSTQITIEITIGEKMLMVATTPKAIGKMIEHRTGGRLAELFKKIAYGGLDLADVMAILGVFERNPEVLTYLEKAIAPGGEAEAEAREGAMVLVMVGAAVGNAAERG